MLKDLLSEGLALIKIRSPSSYPIFVLYLEGLTAKQISEKRDLRYNNVRKTIYECKVYLREFLARNSVTNETLLDGRAVPKEIAAKIALLFPSSLRDS